jgi:hypothetical protein
VAIVGQKLEDVADGWPKGSISVRLSDYMARPHQKWTIEAVPGAGGYLGGPYYRIVIEGTGRALAAAPVARLETVPEFTGVDRELWRIEQLVDGTYRILPKEIPMHTAITQWGNVGGLVAGLCSGNIELVGRAMRDAVAEPYRKGFIPGFDDLRAKLLGAGALAMNISGSGPSVFALANRSDIAQRVGAIMERHFAQQGILSETYVVKVSNKGARLIA